MPQAITRMYSAARGRAASCAPSTISTGPGSPSSTAANAALVASSSSTVPEKHVRGVCSSPRACKMVQRIAPARPMPVPTACSSAAAG